MYKNLNAGVLGIRATISEIVELALAAHFEGVDFALPEMAALVESHGIQYGRSIFESAQIRPGVWPMPVIWNQEDEAFEKELPRLEKHAAVAQELGASRTVVTVEPASDQRPFHDNFEWHRARLGRIAGILASHDCRLGLEFVGAAPVRAKKQHEFIHDLNATLQLIESIGAGNVGIALDSWQWHVSKGSLEEVAKLSAEQIVAVRVSDAAADVPLEEQTESSRCFPGETGQVSNVELLQALNNSGYEGPVTPVPFIRRVRQMSRERATRVAGQALDQVWQQAGLVPEPVASEESTA